MKYKKFQGKQSRYQITKQYVKKFISGNTKILDLGYMNDFTNFLFLHSKQLFNTSFDLDLHPNEINKFDYDYVTSFEVFEHLLNPYSLLKAIKPGTVLVCSVPLRVWFTKPHWNKDSEYDQHYHEFITREFNKLLKKTGFEIVYAKRHMIIKNFGFRQILTWLLRSKRYYFVVAKKC